MKQLRTWIRSWLGLEDADIRIAQLEQQLAAVRQRTINYYRNRWDAVDSLADYLVGAQLPGDYLEFGVYRGTTFAYACKIMQPIAALAGMRFVACDSFQGLPQPTGVDRQDGYSSSFTAGEFRSSQEEFDATLQREGVDRRRVEVIPGWFHESLTPAVATAHKIEKVAAAWIDCDLYESTVPVLEFLTPRLSLGSVLLFDDWRCFRNQPEFGEQRACAEWLQKNPCLKLYPFISFGFHGQSFTVGAC